VSKLGAHRDKSAICRRDANFGTHTLGTILLDEPVWAEQLEIVETHFSEFARPN
jgi:hypothetical protein